ncbi:MAG: UvrD-helicase domain-containing protein [Prevotella sp.]|nr:UvrD-helicase domain-containing protein [Prevotella sp.]
MKNDETFRPDESQRRVIGAYNGYHLVLAPPGCGKTQILTERIQHAHVEYGVEYEDMLCLTFTNRAARGMLERIRAYIDDANVEKVFVGNVHRFCSKFLFEYNLVPAESSIIDEEDAVSIIARYLDEDEMEVMNNTTRRRTYDEIVHFSHFMHQIIHRHPKTLRLHPECVNSDDIVAMKNICDVRQMAFDADGMGDIYEQSDFYMTQFDTEEHDYGERQVIGRLLRKMKLARQYQDYKQQNKLLDFEDLLILTYDALMDERFRLLTAKFYRWIQVDEVQDLNPLQLAIIDAITDRDRKFTVMYLGDEQQAIFSFMGAKVSTLDSLREKCAKNLHHLYVNHRSPKYLLEVFNEYAITVLNIPRTLLPKANNVTDATGKELRILRSSVVETEFYDVARVAQNFFMDFPNETTAIIVNSNSDADMMSTELNNRKLRHFKVSGVDLFSTPEMKLLLAHLNILSNEHNFIAWSRLLKGLRVFDANASARNFMRSLLNRAMLPSDFLLYQDSTYLQDFAQVFSSDEIVVFDTETTGLNVYEDDIIQIAAVKMRQGKIVDGSQFNMYISTRREIPEKIGDIDNPVLKEMARNRLYSPVEALQRFIDYVGNRVLVGHNANFDYHILENNLSRYLPQIKLREYCPKYFDSLKLIRLVEPDLKEYKLKYLLSVLELPGENSHLADADVNATCGLLNYCYDKAQELIPSQQEFMARTRVIDRVGVLRRDYREFYLDSLENLYVRHDGENPDIIDEMEKFYQYLVNEGFMKEIPNLHYVTQYITHDMVDMENEPSLAVQLSNHIIEMNTMKEADLCNSKSIDDRIFVSTVHKAKGLEFDNVIIFDAIEGRYPNYYHQNNANMVAEDARKFYVAMTRAKKRLYVSICQTRMDYKNQPQMRKITRFMNPIMKYFD